MVWCICFFFRNLHLTVSASSFLILLHDRQAFLDFVDIDQWKKMFRYCYVYSYVVDVYLFGVIWYLKVDGV